MKFLSGLLGVLAILALVCLLLGLPLMILWNWLMPLIFSLPTITFWQAVGLNFLASILFGKTSTTAKNG
jgi:hypothetical protein